MAYVDKTYYDETYHGESVDEADFPTIAERATDIINAVAGYKIPALTDIGSTFIVDQIKKATCCQIEYIDLMSATTTSPLQSTGLGKFSYSNGNSTPDSTLVNPRVYDYLMPTGYLYRGL